MARINRIIANYNAAINAEIKKLTKGLRFEAEHRSQLEKVIKLLKQMKADEVLTDPNFALLSTARQEQINQIATLINDKNTQIETFLAAEAEAKTQLNELHSQLKVARQQLKNDAKTVSDKRYVAAQLRQIRVSKQWSTSKWQSLGNYFLKFTISQRALLNRDVSPEIVEGVRQYLELVEAYNTILRDRLHRIRTLENAQRQNYFQKDLEKDRDGREILLKIQDLVISFGAGSQRFVAVRDINLNIFRGEVFGLVGESGSGKTTIGRAIVKINPTYAGKIIYRGVNISKRLSRPVLAEMRKRIQMIYQDPAASLNERATVDYIVSEGLRAFNLYDNEAERIEKVQAAMVSVGLLPEHLRRYPHEFSGGQRQRIGIARSIVMRPEFIIADEPISALDVSIRAQILNLLKQFQKDYDLTYLFIAHDLSVMRHIADRIAVISRGRIVELAPAELLFLHPLHDYTVSLLSAIPQPDPKLEREKKLIHYEPRFYQEGEDVVFFEIEKDHFVLGNMEEIARYRARLAMLKTKNS